MGSDFWISYTDIMTALLFIFILVILCFVFRLNDLGVDHASLQKYKELLKENQRLKAQLAELNESKNDFETFKKNWYEADDAIIEMLRRITRELNDKHHIQVTLDTTNKTLNVDSTVIGFDKGKHDIKKDSYLSVVNTISNILKRELDGEVRKKIDAIFIEGYTDDNFYDDDEIFGNWGLSALRAISFWEALKKSNNLQNIKNANDKKLLFSVSGYANIRPIDCAVFANDTNLKDSWSFSPRVKEKACKDFQKCVMSDKDISPRFCQQNWTLGKILRDEYDTKNRRIGIRFIPFHKNRNTEY